MFPIIFFGLFLGIIIFFFTLIVSKKNGKLYLAPLVTFLAALLITAYGLFKVRGFEGMAYGVLGACFLSIAIVGVMLLPFFAKKINDRRLTKVDKSILVILPIIFFASIGLLIYTNEDFWVIDKGVVMENTAPSDSYYNVSTISEGAKQVHIQLGEEYVGKGIEIEKVKTVGNTEIVVKVVDGTDINKVPYITIGLDEIVEPLKVKTTDGKVIGSIRNNY
ncbi:MAG: hypothetical protein ACI35O_03205 [Bacillaceae bacterium]